MKVTWNVLKDFSVNKGGNLSYVEDANRYIIIGFKGELKIFTTIPKTTPAHSVQIDFETNFKAGATVFGDAISKPVILQGVGLIGDAIKVSGGSGVKDTIDKKTRVEFWNTGLSLTSTYQPLYSYTGAGKFFGGKFKISSSDMDIKMTVDGEIVFDLNLESIVDLANEPYNFIEVDEGDEDSFFELEFKWPVEYAASILLEAKSSDSNSVDEYLVALTKEV